MSTTSRGQTLVVCGKGGVGKTTVSALLCRHLAARADRRTLAVDADHAGGLSLALGIDPQTTLRHVREQALGELTSRDTSRKADLAQSVAYQLQAALTEREGLAFLAMGRPEERGCFCAVNSVLKRAWSSSRRSSTSPSSTPRRASSRSTATWWATWTCSCSSAIVP